MTTLADQLRALLHTRLHVTINSRTSDVHVKGQRDISTRFVITPVKFGYLVYSNGGSRDFYNNLEAVAWHCETLIGA